MKDVFRMWKARRYFPIKSRFSMLLHDVFISCPRNAANNWRYFRRKPLFTIVTDGTIFDYHENGELFAYEKKPYQIDYGSPTEAKWYVSNGELCFEYRGDIRPQAQAFQEVYAKWLASKLLDSNVFNVFHIKVRPT